ncbi:hypothetical protein MNBD_CHLOROFLEXI01-1856 [hydrothermal vent metagenome]|uniref:Bacterial transcriptional activator domain-containing protein n=1 Tax=hydrothermal vent metagenome TaxID=652676 RepID=A0A3B0W4Z9_9ZZZZ
MTLLQISFLGSVQLFHETGEIVISRRKVMALLAFLALEAGQSHSREMLLGLLWPELPEVDARNNLRVSLARLRKRLQQGNTAVSLLITTRKEVRFQLDDTVTFDVATFQALLADSERCNHTSYDSCPMCQERLAAATALYRGLLLHGFYLDECPAFDEWLFVQRERLHLQMMELLDELAQGMERNGRFPQAISYTRRQLELDPLHDDAQRRLLRLLAYQGQYSIALSQYQAFKLLLHEELGVEPDLELVQLAQQIKTRTLPIPGEQSAAETAVHPSNLPENLTPFFGREQELKQLSARLADPQYRLITLVGPGGIGKTRLAQESVRSNLHNYKDGAFFVPLAPVERVQNIATAVADALNLPLTNSTQSPPQQLIQYLTAKKILLIIDNMEHLMDGVDLLLDILRHCPGVVLLVTSRQRLDVQAEDMFRLRGLPVPTDEQVEQAGQFAAVRLFCDRAHRLQKPFKLTPKNASDIVAICRAVEGLPLGLVLAACWIRDFPVADLARMITGNVDMLQTTMGDIAPQHRSIRAVFDTSWRLLSPAEQVALAQLSVFRSGFTLAAAKQVIGVSLLDITKLRYKSLLRGGGNGRYTMHELLRQMSRQKLNEDQAAAEQTKIRHGRYFLSLLQEQADRLNGIDAAQAGTALQLELDNIRQAWRWAVETSALEQLRQSTVGLTTFLEHIGLAYEGVQLLQLAIDSLSTPTNSKLLPFLLVRQLFLLKSISTLDENIAIIKRVFSLTERNSTLSHLEAETYLIWSMSSLDQVSDPKQARIYLNYAFMSSEKLDNPEFAARLQCESGRNYLYDGQFDKAIAVLEDALAIFEELGHIPGQALAYSHLAPTYAEAYRLGPALFCDRKALFLYRQVDNRTKLGIGHHNLAETYVLLGAYEQAKVHTVKSLEISRRQGNKVGEANTLSLYAAILDRLGQIEEAETQYRVAIAAQKALKLNFSLRFSLLDWGTFQLQKGRLAEAEITFDEAIALNDNLDYLRLTSQAKQALVYLAQGQREKEALTLADMVWQEIEPNGGASLPFPIHTMYESYSVFRACGDDQAEAALQMAADVLKRTAAEIEDPEMRTSFLNNVPVNRQLRVALHEESVG